MRMEDRSPELKKAIGLAGGLPKLARIAGVTVSTLCEWTRVPTRHVIKIERALNGAITRHEMRPDVFGEEPKNLDRF